MDRAIVITALLSALSGTLCAASIEEATELLEAGRPSVALKMLEALEDDAAGVRLLWMTRAANELDDWRRALDYGEQVVGRMPSSSDAHLAYAIAIRNKMAEVGKLRALAALGAYKRELARAIELDPQSADAHQEEIGYLINAPGIAGGDKARAREKLEELREISPVDALVMEAELEIQLDNRKAAYAIWTRILELEPDNTSARMSRAMALQSEQQWSEADGDFELLLERDPGSVRRLSALYQLGRSRVLGEFEAAAAVEYFDRFVAERPEGVAGGVPDRADALWRRGLALEQLARPAEARESYQRALREDARHSQARKALAALD